MLCLVFTSVQKGLKFVLSTVTILTIVSGWGMLYYKDYKHRKKQSKHRLYKR